VALFEHAAGAKDVGHGQIASGSRSRRGLGVWIWVALDGEVNGVVFFERGGARVGVVEWLVGALGDRRLRRAAARRDRLPVVAAARHERSNGYDNTGRA